MFIASAPGVKSILVGEIKNGIINTKWFLRPGVNFTNILQAPFAFCQKNYKAKM